MKKEAGRDARKFILCLVLIFIGALAIRGLVLWRSSPISFRGDELEYVSLAETLLKEGRFVTTERKAIVFQGGKPGEPTAFRSPALPLFLAAHYKIFGHSHVFPRLTLIFLSSTICIFLAVIGRCAGYAHAGLLASALWAVNPPSVVGDYSSDRLCSENLGVFFLTGGFTALTLFYLKPGLRRITVAGLFLGIAVLSRGYLLFVLPVCAVFIYLFTSVRRWLYLSLFTLIISLVVGGWATRNLYVMGKPMLSTATDHFYVGNNLWARGSFNGDFNTLGYDAPQIKVIKDRYPNMNEMSEIELSEMWSREAVRSITSNPRRFAWLLMRKSLVFWGPFQYWSYGAYKKPYLFSFMLIFALFAVIRSRDRHTRRLVMLFSIPAISVFGAELLTYASDRHRFVTEPCIFFLGAIGIIEAAGPFIKSRKGFDRLIGCQIEKCETEK
jgi:Dolichyl-phosphate-mannose-protein mannosyltransferase